MTDVNTLLREGIKALKAGQRDKARQLLKQVVKLDEENERGWLWLSGAVTTRDERRICLENVLTLNPDNEMAQKGLAKLGFPLPDASQPDPTPSPAEDWSTPYYDQSVLPEPPPSHQSKFDDVWTSGNDLCAYCAHPVTRKSKTCSNCKRPLLGKEPVYPTRSKYLWIWVILRSILHAFQLLGMFLLIYILLSDSNAFLPYINLSSSQLITIILLATLIPIGLTIALFYRQVWAYWLIIAAHVLELIYYFAQGAAQPDIPVPANTPQPSIWIVVLCCLVPVILIEGAYLYIIFMASGDFKKVTRWRFATASDRIKDPYMMDQVAGELAKRNMWAAAVVYWQRAVGRSPGNTAYIRRLADGYARLGFLERSLDVLKTGLEKVKEPVAREEIMQQIMSVESKLKEQTT